MTNNLIQHLRRFYLERDVDATGVSGTGRVASGVCFPSGSCVMEWLVPPQSMGIYETIADLIAIHGHGGQTQVCWLDEDPDLLPRD